MKHKSWSQILQSSHEAHGQPDKSSRGVEVVATLREDRRKFIHTVYLCIASFACGFVVCQRSPSILDLGLKSRANLQASAAFFSLGAGGFTAGYLLAGVTFDRFYRQMFLFWAMLGVCAATAVLPWCVPYSAMATVYFIGFTFVGSVETGCYAVVARMWGRRGRDVLKILQLAYVIGGIISPVVTHFFLVHRPITFSVAASGPGFGMNTSLATDGFGIERNMHDTKLPVAASAHGDADTEASLSKAAAGESNSSLTKVTERKRAKGESGVAGTGSTEGNIMSRNGTAQKSAATRTNSTDLNTAQNLWDQGNETTTEKPKLNPLSPIPPSAQLSGGRYGASRVDTLDTTNYNFSKNDSETTALNHSANYIVRANSGSPDKLYIAYTVSAAICLLAALPFLHSYVKTSRPELKAQMSVASDDSRDNSQRRRREGSKGKWVLLLVVAFFYLATAVEDSFHQFLFTFVVCYSKWTELWSALLTAWFWCGVAAVRMVSLVLPRLLSEETVLVASCCGTVCCLAGLHASAAYHFDPGIWICVLLTGMSTSLILPLSFSWLHTILMRTNSAGSQREQAIMTTADTLSVSAVVMIASSLAGVLNPLAMGSLMQNSSPAAFTYLLLAEAALAVIMLGMLMLVSRTFFNSWQQVSTRSIETEVAFKKPDSDLMQTTCIED